jgi:hypothetical protein
MEKSACEAALAPCAATQLRIWALIVAYWKTARGEGEKGKGKREKGKGRRQKTRAA